MSSATKKSKKQMMKEYDEDGDEPIPIELTKEEAQIARYLRLSCPNKQANLSGIKVNFFIANKLVDNLMESKWGPNNVKKNSKQQPIFANRQACIEFMKRMMNKQLFYRVVKVYKDQITNNSSNNLKELGESSASTGTTTSATPSTLKKRKGNKEDTNKDENNLDTPQASKLTPSSTPSTQKDASNQNKRKFKLEIHEVQTFVDSNEPYVWIYDPTSTTTYIIGLLLIIGSIAVCCFPLWPSQVREGVYYLSVAGISLLGAILALAAFKYILFGFLWAITLGNFHFWLFPNLTEDVGFFESFVPVYQIGSGKKPAKSIKKDKSDDNPATATATGSLAAPVDSITSKPLVTSSMMMDSVNVKTTTSQSSVSSSVYELSKSTVEIKSSDSPFLLTKSTRNNLNGGSIDEDEEGFELVDDDDLVKMKDNESEDQKSN